MNIQHNTPDQLLVTQHTRNRRGSKLVAFTSILLVFCLITGVMVGIYIYVQDPGSTYAADVKLPLPLTICVVLVGITFFALPILAYVQEHKVRDSEPKNWLMWFFSDSVPVTPGLQRRK